MLGNLKLDCGIHYCFLHNDMPYPNPGTGGGWTVGQEKVHAKFTIVCEFLNKQMTIAEVD